MPGALPDGEPVPAGGALPETALAGIGDQPFGVYVHVPFCASRCGYCDFNTYTPNELGSGELTSESERPAERERGGERARKHGGGASQRTYADTAISEVRLARRVLGRVELPVRTVFFGGGTPTVLPVDDLVSMLRAIDDAFGLAPDAEVSTEANPESVDARSLAQLREAGFTRVSLGMQSAREHVLQVLDRAHTPGRAQEAVGEARSAGFEHVSLDLIYGTPGETDADWRASLEAAVDAGADHISAYGLIVEDGTRLAARVRRGELPSPDDDVLADRYLAADEVLSGAGFDWYEVSNWAATPGGRCRHNLLYWTGADWWGVGPGAHSHVQGVRWWNVKHPAPYAARLADGRTPAQAREVLGFEERWMERVLLALRLDSGLPLEELTDRGRKAARDAANDGLLEPRAHERHRAVLTLRGRLLADAVVRDLTD